MYGLDRLKIIIWARVILWLCLFVFFLNLPLFASVVQEAQFETSFQENKELKINSALFSKGIDVSNYRTTSFALKEGQTLSSILQPYGISVPKVLRLCEEADNYFDPHRMTTGQTYFIVHDFGNNQKVKFFLFEISNEELIVFEFDSTPRAFIYKKDIERRIKNISVKVDKSLWATLKRHGLNTELIPRLEEVFNRSVNLSKLMPNDLLGIRFEEYYDSDVSVRVGSIVAAKLISGDSTVAAFHYSHCDTEGYYDENGNNHQTAFLPSPIKNARITSGYSTNRMHPITEKYQRHLAIDFAAPTGTPVLSVGDGAIIDFGFSESGGNYIGIRHSVNFTSQYLHLSRFADGMKVGLNVRKGDVIGFVGDTGFATGPHLDFRLPKMEGSLIIVKSTYLMVNLWISPA